MGIWEAALMGIYGGLLFLGSWLVFKSLVEMEEIDDPEFKDHIISKYGLGDKDDPE